MMDVFSDRLRKLREERNLMQSDVVSHLNISRSAYSNYENGRMPPIDFVIECANFFNVTSDYLLGLSQEKRPAVGSLEQRFADLARVAGADSIVSSDLSSLLSAFLMYYKSNAPAGGAPMDATRQFIQVIPHLLNALSQNDTAAVLGHVNDAAAAALAVNQILVQYLSDKKAKP